MENKIELIPASELPVAEGNEVEMLVVENGELKRKEADSGVKTVNGIEPDENGDVEVSSGVRTVNGIEPDENGNVEVSSGGGYDLVIISNEDNSQLVFGSYNSVVSIIESGNVPRVCVVNGSTTTVYDEQWHYFGICPVDGIKYYHTYDPMICIYCKQSEEEITLHPDNSLTYNYIG